MSTLEDQVVAEIMDELEKDKLVLPSLPEVALRVRDTLEDENVTTEKIAKVLMTDPGLTARVIQIANSPLVRGAKKIESIEMAITRMGNTMVRNVVNSLIVQQIFQPTTDISDQKFREFWDHSAQVAAISHALAGYGKLKPDQALLAGLLHDIGALPVIKRSEDIPELLSDMQVLNNIISRTHTQIGLVMLKKWELPQELVDVAGEHENLQRNNSDPIDLVDIVIVANLQSYMGSDHPHSRVDWKSVPAFAKLGLDTEVSIVDMENGETIREVHDSLLLAG